MIVAISGKSCAGKNRVADIFAHEYKYRVVDFDKLAHIALDEQASQIVEAFGNSVILPHYSSENSSEDKKLSIDRQALGKIVFSNPQKLQQLEAILHPQIDRAGAKLMAADPNANWVLNIPVLHKSKLVLKVDVIIWVKARWRIRFFRAIQRDSYSRINILKRFFAQRDFSVKKAHVKKEVVDIHTITNNGSAEMLNSKVHDLIEKYEKREFRE